MLKEGDSAPDFTLEDAKRQSHTLSSYRGHWVLLYFYPKDDTPGCTKEACSIRDNLPRFEETSLVVLGVSTDSTESHKKFAEKYQLPFTLLSDSDKKIVNLYGVWGEKKNMGRTYMGTKRTSFLIAPDGKIARVYENVKPEIHVEEVLKDLSALQ